MSDAFNALQETKINDSFLELGVVIGLLGTVVEVIPSEYPYKYGLSYVYALNKSMPNFGINRGQNNRSAVKGMSSKEAYEMLNFSDWYVYTFNRWMFDNGGGSGFSCLAEVYANFGIFFSVLFFFIAGCLFSYADRIFVWNSLRSIVLPAIIYWPILMLVRNESGAILKAISFSFYIFIFYVIMTFLFKQFSIKR